MAGYSQKTLAEKLGIKTGFRVKVDRPPAHYLELLGSLPERVTVSNRLRGDIDLWHLFVRRRRRLDERLRLAVRGIRRDGMIWVSWPKKSSGVVSELTEGAIREAAFPLDLVDVKVCAVDQVWSGLKLVIRKSRR